MAKNHKKNSYKNNSADFVQIPELDYKMLVAQNERMKEQITSLQSDCRRADAKPMQPKNNFELIKEMSLNEMVEHYFTFACKISNKELTPLMSRPIIRDWLLSDGGNG